MNQWVTEPGFTGLYVRFGPRYIGRTFHDFLDIGYQINMSEFIGTVGWVILFLYSAGLIR